jgi:general secretion pathway protein I
MNVPNTLLSFPIPSPLRGGLGRGCAPGTSSRPRRTCRPIADGNQRSGFTLLEVILALVILAASLAMLGEVMQLATRQAVDARTETYAQSLAASVMDQIISGAIDATAVSRQQLEVDDTTPWVYSIVIGTSDIVGIMPVEVTVEQDIEARLTPVKFRLFRWLPSVLERPESGGGAMQSGPGGQSGGASGPSSGSGSPSGGAAMGGSL